MVQHVTRGITAGVVVGNQQTAERFSLNLYPRTYSPANFELDDASTTFHETLFDREMKIFNYLDSRTHFGLRPADCMYGLLGLAS